MIYPRGDCPKEVERQKDLSVPGEEGRKKEGVSMPRKQREERYLIGRWQGETGYIRLLITSQAGSS